MKSIGEMNIRFRGKGEKRKEIFEYFFERLYPDWCSFKKLKQTPSSKKTFQKFLALKFGYISTEDLIGLKGKCLDAEKHCTDPKKKGSIFAVVFYASFKKQK